ncbi:hypothetical protein ABENE_23040 [Asticcacaulis benevestitus DSM 16100 = ATCC BAA-896]|uniref:Uncharacterized protein n=1 Tax=Asticcacaulis benevestitus DSM 16100 = ATCC BAA-896 TaxID=1121022 RepID=V4NUK8_9CAUL|nr:hypothetical protein ABENE_23040 [Asticcacaulis benevestitus DSM 16100 = ATCC BAA-896]
MALVNSLFVFDANEAAKIIDECDIVWIANKLSQVKIANTANSGPDIRMIYDPIQQLGTHGAHHACVRTIQSS